MQRLILTYSRGGYDYSGNQCEQAFPHFVIRYLIYGIFFGLIELKMYTSGESTLSGEALETALIMKNLSQEKQ